MISKSTTQWEKEESCHSQAEWRVRNKMLNRIHKDCIVDGYKNARIYKKAFNSWQGIKKLLENVMGWIASSQKYVEFLTPCTCDYDLIWK